MAVLRDEPGHLPREQPPLNLCQRRMRERQADEAQIHHDHETGEGDDAGDVRRLDDRVAPGGLADRSRPGEPLEPLEGGDDRGHREVRRPRALTVSAPSFGPPTEPM